MGETTLVNEKVFGMKKTLENNKLIAEFMGLKVVEKEGSFFGYAPYQYQPGVFTEWHCICNSEEEAFKHAYSVANDFHKSWDWLMPVVEKIETLDRLGGIVTIKQGSCRIESNALGDNTIYAQIDHYFLKGVEGKLEATYKAVIEFIKWYNNEKNKESS